MECRFLDRVMHLAHEERDIFWYIRPDYAMEWRICQNVRPESDSFAFPYRIHMRQLRYIRPQIRQVYSLSNTNIHPIDGFFPEGERNREKIWMNLCPSKFTIISLNSLRISCVPRRANWMASGCLLRKCCSHNSALSVSFRDSYSSECERNPFRGSKILPDRSCTCSNRHRLWSPTESTDMIWWPPLSHDNFPNLKSYKSEQIKWIRSSKQIHKLSPHEPFNLSWPFRTIRFEFTIFRFHISRAHPNDAVVRVKSQILLIVRYRQINYALEFLFECHILYGTDTVALSQLE